MVPRRTRRLTPLTATKPRKSLVSPSVRRIVSSSAMAGAAGSEEEEPAALDGVVEGVDAVVVLVLERRVVDGDADGGGGVDERADVFHRLLPAHAGCGGPERSRVQDLHVVEAAEDREAPV